MKHLKPLSILFFALFFTGSAAAQTAPDWYNSGSLPDYNKEMYLTGVGAGSAPDVATNNASNDIAEQIRVNVKSTTESVQKEVVEDGSSSFSEMFQSAVTSSVNETISGIEIVKQQKSGGTHYAFASLDKSKYLNSLREKLQKQENSINSLVNEARQFSEKGQIVATIDNFSSAMEQIPKFYADKSLYDALSESPYQQKQQFGVSKIESELRDLLSNIEIQITSGNRQKAQAGEPLPEPISFKLQYRYRGEEVALSGVTIKASYKDGATIDRVTTDQQGEASILAETVPPNRGSRGEIMVEPVIPNLPYGFTNYTQTAGTSAQYEVSDQMPLMMTVDIRDKDKNPLRRVNDKVIRSLERMGHTITESAPLKLEGTVEVIEAKEVETMGKTQTLVRAELSTQMMVAASGEIIGTFSSVEEGLSTSGKEAAMKSAYNRMQISRRTFSNFLARSQNKLESVFGETSKEYLEAGKKLMDEEKYQEAIEELKLVTIGQEHVREAREQMREAIRKLNANNGSVSTGSMAGYTSYKTISFDEYNDGDFLKQYGDEVVVKGGNEEEKYATVFQDSSLFSVELPKDADNIAIEIRAEVAEIKDFDQQFTINGESFTVPLTFNIGYYQEASFGDTQKNIDSLKELGWDNFGTNVIRFEIGSQTIKTFINGKFFGASEVESTSGNKSIDLKLDQDSAIYGIKLGTK